MDTLLTVKKALFQACQTQLDERIRAIRDRLQSIEESRNEETKSSAGDKYETGRAMMQMEEDKIKRQLSEVLLTRTTLSQIDPTKKSEIILPGSLVKTNKGYYFLSIGLGKIKQGGQLYYAVSSQSPIGKALLHKKQGDQFLFNNSKTVIEHVY